MTDFTTLSCPACGGQLTITPDVDRFACAHCGREHLVKRGPGIIYLAPVINEMRGIREASTRTAAELAIPRLEEEITALKARREQILASPPFTFPCGFALLALGSVLALLGACTSVNFIGYSYIWLSLAMLAIGIVAIAGGFRLAPRDEAARRRTNEEMTGRTVPIDAQLERLNAELQEAREAAKRPLTQSGAA